MNGEIRSPPKEEELKLKGFAYLLKLEADQNHNRYYRMVQEIHGIICGSIRNSI